MPKTGHIKVEEIQSRNVFTCGYHHKPCAKCKVNRDVYAYGDTSSKYFGKFLCYICNIAEIQLPDNTMAIWKDIDTFRHGII